MRIDSTAGKQIAEFKRGRHWRDSQPFTTNDVASALGIKGTKASQLLTLMKPELETIKPEGRSAATKGLRYVRKCSSSILNSLWIPNTATDEYGPQWKYK